VSSLYDQLASLAAATEITAMNVIEFALPYRIADSHGRWAQLPSGFSLGDDNGR